MKAYAAFPFPADDQDDRLHWLRFLSAFALITSGASVLSNPGYYHSPSSDVNRRGPARKRGLHQRMRLLFQCLASIPPDCHVSHASGSKAHKNEDLIDTMAVCMDVEDDKYVFYARDFIPAMSKLPSSMTNRVLDWKIAPNDWMLLLRIPVHYLAQCYGIQPESEKERLALAEVVAQRIQCHRQNRRQRQDTGWRDFHGIASSSLVRLLSKPPCCGPSSHFNSLTYSIIWIGTFPEFCLELFLDDKIFLLLRRDPHSRTTERKAKQRELSRNHFDYAHQKLRRRATAHFLTMLP